MLPVARGKGVLVHSDGDLAQISPGCAFPRPKLTCFPERIRRKILKPSILLTDNSACFWRREVCFPLD